MKKNLGRLMISLSAAAMLFQMTGCGTTTSSATSNNAATSWAPLTTTLTGNWEATYDTLIHYAKIETDAAKRTKMMHKAEDLLMSTGCLMPIYYYTDQYLLNSAVKNLLYSPMGYKLFTYATKTGSTQVDACIASEPGSIDPALNTTVDGANYIAHAFTGLYALGDDGNGGVKPVPGCATGYTTTTAADGSIKYDFTMRAGLKWSDGTTLDANDFVYSWNRTASGKTGASYAYMFDCIGNAAKTEADTTGTEKLEISASEDGTHFYCTLPVACGYFEQLCAFPVYAPVQKATVEKNDVTDVGVWATDPSTYVCNGPYKISAWTHSSSITMVKNPNYYDAANVKIEKIVWHLSDDDANIYSEFEKGDLDLADSFPSAEIDAIKTKYSAVNEYYNMPNLGTYYYEFNVNEAGANASGYAVIADTEAKRQSFRRGLSLLVDRNYIVNSVTKGGQTPANTFVGAGVTDAATGADFTKQANDGKGYYSVASADYTSNVAEGVELIKAAGFTYDAATKKFTNVPAVKFSTNTSSGHAAVATAVQSEFAAYGITLDIQQASDWNAAVAARTAGQYECSRAGWLCDYNDAMNMLEMWLSNSGNNDAQFGRDANKEYTGYTIDLTGIVA